MIDFSCKHDVLIENEDGTMLPMDEPYFTSKQIADGTWIIRTDGDAIYLLEGSEEAIVIDSGYGAGDLRAYCQSLTQKPVKCIINTHDHFDHTANNSYFEKAYMTEASKELATIPFPSFEGIEFPRDYPVEIVKDGDIIDIGGRPLEIIEMPDHAAGSIVILDKKEKILFAGDEISSMFKKVNTSISNVRVQYQRLWNRRDEISVIWPGAGIACHVEILRTYIEIFDSILAGNMGEAGFGFKGPDEKMKKDKPEEAEGKVIYQRFHARKCDMKLEKDARNLRNIKKDGVMVMFTPDVIK